MWFVVHTSCCLSVPDNDMYLAEPWEWSMRRHRWLLQPIDIDVGLTRARGRKRCTIQSPTSCMGRRCVGEGGGMHVGAFRERYGAHLNNSDLRGGGGGGSCKVVHGESSLFHVIAIPCRNQGLFSHSKTNSRRPKIHLYVRSTLQIHHGIHSYWTRAS